MIESEDTKEAVDKVAQILEFCFKFKETYFNYKAKAGGTWKIQNNALFARLDGFTERCQDILHLTSTIVQFMGLNTIEIGGTKGKILSSSILQIHSEFCDVVDEFRKLD